MRGEQDGGFGGDFVEFINEYGPFSSERLYDVLVVNDFVVDEDRGAKMVQG